MNIKNKEVIILIILAGVLFFFKLGSFSLYDAVETIYGEFIKQIRLTGDWLTMHYNGEIIFDKPPLYFWLATIATYIFGFNEFAIRFWAALCGVLTVVTTFYLGKAFYNKKTGFLSGIVVMTAFQFLIQSRIAEIDILLTLLISLTFLCFWQRRYLLMYVCMALAMITKGLIGAALPGFAIFLFLLLKNVGTGLVPVRARLKEMQIIPGIIIILIIAGPWYIGEWLLHGEKFTQFIMGFLFLSRFQGVVAGHPGPWYYYFLAIILGFAPWSHFLPYSFIRTWKNRFSSPELLSLCYIIPVFLVFSIAKTKLPNYLLPLYPFLAIMVGKLWHDMLSKSFGSDINKGMFLSNILLAVVIVLIIIGFVILGRSNYSGQYLELLPNLKLLAGILIIGGLLSMVFGLWSKWKLSFATLPVMVFLIALILTIQTLPAVEKYKGTKELAEAVSQKIKAEQIIAAYDTGNRPGVVFYNSKPVEFLTDEDQVLSFIREKQGYCFISKDSYKKLNRKFETIENQGELVVIYD